MMPLKTYLIFDELMVRFMGNSIYDYGMNWFFKVEIGDIKMSFSRVSGLDVELEFEPYKEGGVNDYMLEFSKIKKNGHLVLERGTGEVSKLIKWFQDIQLGKFVRKNGTIELWNETGETIRTWQIENALPVKWSGPSLDATGKDIAIEKFELKHLGLKEK